MSKRTVFYLMFVVVALSILVSVGSSPLEAATLVNSNRTGEMLPGVGMLRNTAGQLVHSNFQLNTNSCASCHMTHTSPQQRLLMQPSRSIICMTCHDGTMGFLNVKAPPSGGGFGGSVAAGTFAVHNSVYNPSLHNVDVFPTVVSGVYYHFDAHGGRRDGITERGAWTPTLSCVSCHAPHGSYSIRLLHFNPNQIAVRPQLDSMAFGVSGGSYQVSASTNFTVRAGVYDEVYRLWRYSLHSASSAPWVYGYTHVHLVNSERIPQFWTRVYAPAIFDPNTAAGAVYADPTADVGQVLAPMLLTRFFGINFMTGAVTQTDEQRSAYLSYVMGHGFTEAQALDMPLRIDAARALQVRARASSRHFGNLDAGLRELDLIDPRSYEAAGYNRFCSACHTDYLPSVSASAQRWAGVGIYTRRIRHPINNVTATASAAALLPVYGWTEFSGSNLTGSPSGIANQLICLSCHFAHGSDTRLMTHADGTRVPEGFMISASGVNTVLLRFLPDEFCQVCLRCHAPADLP